MTKAWCIWCETGTAMQNDKTGMVWIHQDCFLEMDNVRDKIIEVEKYMKGEMPRLNTVGNKLGYDNVIEFLNAMADFDRRMRNVSKLIKAMRNQESSVVTEFISPERSDKK
jgi:oligoribonuclease (3'-5' exoribonuclease)